MTNINKDILDDDDSLAVEADDTVEYQPDSSDNVVVVEPMVITQGRAKRRKFLKNEPLPDL